MFEMDNLHLQLKLTLISLAMNARILFVNGWKKMLRKNAKQIKTFLVFQSHLFLTLAIVCAKRRADFESGLNRNFGWNQQLKLISIMRDGFVVVPFRLRHIRHTKWTTAHIPSGVSQWRATQLHNKSSVFLFHLHCRYKSITFRQCGRIKSLRSPSLAIRACVLQVVR